MKRIISFIVLAMLLSCKNDKQPTKTSQPEAQEEVAYVSFGKEIIADDAVKVSSMAQHYKTMAVGDSIPSKMLATVEQVCQAKGCWMKLKLDDSSQVMVKFKDYGFFVPKNIAGKEVVINGKAYVTETSVNELRHYAEDAGKSKEEIEAIITPERTFAFEADGVLLKEE